ncbi:Chloramphenicol resistance protein [Synechocystis sp. PCC 6714]|nr:Chloramphenicol resistance protein [Synechocystis sp. PCC 6714]
MQQHDRLFLLLAMAAGLIFLQGYMIAPLIPRLAEIFDVSAQEIGFIVPAYMLSYALAALFYGILSDRFGRWPVIQISMVAIAAIPLFGHEKPKTANSLS